jgi:Uma2 family endonuclease
MSTAAPATGIAPATMIVPPSSAPAEGRGPTVRLLSYDFEIPPISSLAEFQEWVASDRFPERGRIDYIAGCIEVDMSPEDLYCHGTLTSELHWGVAGRVKRICGGQTFVKQARLVSPEGDLSAEPDILYVSFESLQSGRVVRRPWVNDAERYIAFDGAADLAIEAVSNSSVKKDMTRLPAAYYRAQVTEFGLVDARGEELLFQLCRRGKAAFEAAPRDAEGYQYSAVLSCWYKLERYRDKVGDWAYELKEKPPQEDSP